MNETHFVFLRLWPGFRPPFPFERFNHLADGKIVEKLNRWAFGQLHAKPDTFRQRYWEWAARATRQSWRRTGTPTEPGEFASRVPIAGGQAFRRSLGIRSGMPPVCRIGTYFGWWSVNGTLPQIEVVSDRMYLCEARDRPLAEDVARAVRRMFSKPRANDQAGKEDFTIVLQFLAPQFGIVPASELDRDSAMDARLDILRGKEGKSIGELTTLRDAFKDFYQVFWSIDAVQKIAEPTPATPDAPIPAEPALVVLQQIVRDPPSFEEDSPDWISSKNLARLLGMTTKELSRYRGRGVTFKQGSVVFTFHDGACLVRRDGARHTYYYVPLLKKRVGHLAKIDKVVDGDSLKSRLDSLE